MIRLMNKESIFNSNIRNIWIFYNLILMKCSLISKLLPNKFLNRQKIISTIYYQKKIETTVKKFKKESLFIIKQFRMQNIGISRKLMKEKKFSMRLLNRELKNFRRKKTIYFSNIRNNYLILSPITPSFLMYWIKVLFP